MNPFQARLFIEQVLEMPTINLAAQYVQANAQLLDRVFFDVLLQMINEEQEHTQVNPGDFINLPISVLQGYMFQASNAGDRIQKLKMLYQYAMQLVQQRNPLPPEEPEDNRPLFFTCARCHRTQPVRAPAFEDIHLLQVSAWAKMAPSASFAAQCFPP